MTIKDIEKQFDKEFGTLYRGFTVMTNCEEQVKSFYRTQITKLLEEYKHIGKLFGNDIYLKTSDEKVIKMVGNWIADLEARERRVRTKEIELDLGPIAKNY
jgi:ABC-type uncharacterized transport system ATPase subunit